MGWHVVYGIVVATAMAGIVVGNIVFYALERRRERRYAVEREHELQESRRRIAEHPPRKQTPEEEARYYQGLRDAGLTEESPGVWVGKPRLPFPE